MRKTSFGLGLAGTITAFVIGIIMLFIGIFSAAFSHVEWESAEKDLEDFEITINDEDVHVSTAGQDIDISGGNGNSVRVIGGGFPNIIFGVIGIWLIASSICLILAGIFGIIGTCITKKRKSIGAGILLILAAIFSIPSLYGLHAFALFTPAGVLAFIKDKHEKDAIEVEHETVEEDII